MGSPSKAAAGAVLHHLIIVFLLPFITAAPPPLRNGTAVVAVVSSSTIATTGTLSSTTTIAPPPPPPPRNATVKAFPWMVSVRLHGRHICGASIVHTNWILTACECVNMHNKSAGDIPVRVYDAFVGSGGTSNSSLLGPGRVYKLNRIIRHSSFVPAKPHLYNLAVIRLEMEIVFNAITSPVLLGRTILSPNRWATISGWGATNSTANTTTSPDLYALAVKTLSAKNCTRMLEAHGYDGGYASDVSVLCAAGGKERGICIGDLGGPLVLDGGIQIGVAAWSGKPCAGGAPDLYTRVAFFSSWILDQIVNDRSKKESD